MAFASLIRGPTMSNLFFSPNFFDVGDAALGLLGGHVGAKFEDFDVLRFYERLERGEINHAGAGRGMVAATRNHVVDVKAGQSRGERFEKFRVLDNAEVL